MLPRRMVRRHHHREPGAAGAALLSGPEGARELLRESGGLIVHDDGEAEIVGRLQIKPRLSITVPAAVIQGVAA